MKIIRIELWPNHEGVDKLFLYTDLPSYTNSPKEIVLSLSVPLDIGGVEYCYRHFPDISIKVVNPVRDIKNIY